MNASSFFMILIFVAIGYVAHPLVLPLIEDKLPRNMQKAVVQQEVKPSPVAVPSTVVESTQPAVVEPSTPVEEEKEVAAQPKNPRIIEEATEPEPEPMVDEPVQEAVVEVVTSDAMDDAQVIEAMQQSVKAGKVTEFLFDEVTSWEFAGEEAVEEVNYYVGIGVVKTTTVFGLTEQKVKALCREGGVVKWLWAVSGVEIQ